MPHDSFDEGGIPPFLYGTHYSTPGCVSKALVDLLCLRCSSFVVSNTCAGRSKALLHVRTRGEGLPFVSFSVYRLAC
jgi:hypothetical protein